MPLDLIGTAEAAALLGIERSTLSRWVALGRLQPTYRLPGPNGAMLYDRTDVEALRDRLKTEACARFQPQNGAA